MATANYALSEGNAVRLLVDGPATYSAMFEALGAARTRVDLECYMIDDQGPGETLAQRLTDRRAQGVAVRVLYDSVGSFETPDSFFARLREAGIEVCEFHPIRPWRQALGLLDINHRDHRKVMVVDDSVAFVGGVNISHEYAASYMKLKRAKKVRGHQGRRDTHLRLRGPAVRWLAEAFEANWRDQRCDDAARNLQALGPARCEDDECDATVAIVAADADRGDAPIRRLLRQALEQARHSARLTMAYFVPDDDTLRALTDAARRGVEVEVILPGQSDSSIMGFAGQAHYQRLLEAGVAIHEHPADMLHAKTVVIDGVWSTIGSCNFDWRSFVHNDEINAVAISPELGQQMEALFDADRRRAKRVDAADWARRGWRQRACEQLVMLGAYWL